MLARLAERSVLVALALALAAPAWSAPTAAPPAIATAADVVARYDDIMSPSAFVTTMTMSATREDGSTRTYVMKAQKQGFDRFRATFQEPGSARGQEMLRVGDNLWSYVPNLKRAVRVASRDSFMGGDFNNGDVLRVNYTADYDAKLLADADAAVVCAELTAKNPSVAYDKIHLCLNKATSQPVRAQYFAQSGKLLRSAVFSDVKDFGNGLVRPAKVEMKNEVQTSRKSVIVWDELKKVDEIPSTRFAVEDLGR